MPNHRVVSQFRLLAAIHQSAFPHVIRGKPSRQPKFSSVLFRRKLPGFFNIPGGLAHLCAFVFCKGGEPGTHAALASFSSSSVPTEIQDLAGIRRIHKSQAG